MPYSDCSVLHGVNSNEKKIQHENKPVLNFKKSMRSVVFQ